jgi:hypothetical protein
MGDQLKQFTEAPTKENHLSKRPQRKKKTEKGAGGWWMGHGNKAKGISRGLVHWFKKEQGFEWRLRPKLKKKKGFTKRESPKKSPTPRKIARA